MFKQKKILFYIIIIMFSFFNKAILANNKSLYDLKINSINGDELNLSSMKGKTILLVNVASKCGFTKQYEELQKLYERYQDKGLVIIGVPSNQFGSQEPGSETEIKDFCETNFNITFPMTSKYDVKGDKAHPIYLWAKETYGKSAVPIWNFHKILINKDGVIEDTFASFRNPLSKKIINKLEQVL
jgi:glutathione peroxidase